MTDRKTPDPERIDPEERASDPRDIAADEFIAGAWQPALRLALDSHGAPKRCNRRACKMAGECRMTVKEGKPLDCGGLTGEAVHTASVAVLFASLVARGLIDGGVVPARHGLSRGTGCAHRTT